MRNLLNTYGVFGVLQLFLFKIRTRFIFKNARQTSPPAIISPISVAISFKPNITARLKMIMLPIIVSIFSFMINSVLTARL